MTKREIRIKIKAWIESLPQFCYCKTGFFAPNTAQAPSIGKDHVYVQLPTGLSFVKVGYKYVTYSDIWGITSVEKIKIEDFYKRYESFINE